MSRSTNYLYANLIDTLAGYIYKLDNAQSEYDKYEAYWMIAIYARKLLGYHYNAKTDTYIPPDDIDYDQITALLTQYEGDPDKIAQLVANDSLLKRLSEKNYDLKQQIEDLKATAEESDTLYTFTEQRELEKELEEAQENISFLSDQVNDLMSQIEFLRTRQAEQTTEPTTEQKPNANGHRPGAKRKYDAETRQRIRDLYNAGHSMATIAKMTEVSKTQIHAIVHETER